LKRIKPAKAGLFSVSPDMPKYDPFILIKRSDPVDPNNTGRRSTKCCITDRPRFRLSNICVVNVNGGLICHTGTRVLYSPLQSPDFVWKLIPEAVTVARSYLVVPETRSVPPGMLKLGASVRNSWRGNWVRG